MATVNTLFIDDFRVSYVSLPGIGGGSKQSTTPPMVLIHSGGASPAQWRPLMDALVEFQPQRPVFAPALMGYGGTARRDGGAPHAQDDGPLLSSFLRAIAPETGVDLVGHSYGGVIAIAAARAAPEVIRSLSLIEPVCFDVLAQTGAEWEWQTIAAFAQQQIKLVAEGNYHEAAQAFLTFWNGPLAWEKLTPSRRGALTSRMPKVAGEWRWILATQTDLSMLKALNRVHLMAGAKTHPIARTVFEVMGSSLPNATLGIIPDAGHMAPLTHARQLAPLLLERVPRFGTFRSRWVKLTADTSL